VYLNVTGKDSRFDIRDQVITHFDTKKGDSSKILDSYFHNEKEKLLKLLDPIRPEHKLKYDKFQKIKQVGIILEGPPGTGKSEFVRRISINLRRHVVVFNMLEVPKDRLIELLQHPWPRHGELTTEKFIFYLDEFDAMIVELKRRESLVNRLDMEKTRTYTQGSCDVLKETFKKDKDTTIDDTINGYANYITYSELLGILQGAIPLDNLIFIATTNNLDMIKQLCSNSNTNKIEYVSNVDVSNVDVSNVDVSNVGVSNVGTKNGNNVDDINMYKKENNECALIRHGRLTPVLCDYFNGKTIKEICMYYFGKSPDIPDDAKPNIINTQIMHWVEIFYDDPNGYELFIQEIFKHMAK